MYDIILASGSPRRREILTNIGLDFRVVKSGADESMEEGIPPGFAAERLSLLKAAEVAERSGENALVIGADTMVAIDGEILGKPSDDADARRMLALLSGRRHSVFTGVSVLRTFDAKSVTFYEETEVYVKKLSEAEIEWYTATGEPRDKAGAYGIQGKGALFIEKINGDYFNVVGLPAARLMNTLINEFEFKLI